MRVFGGFLFLLSALAQAAAAPVDPGADPPLWLRQVYAVYQRAQKTDDKLETEAGVALIEKRASRALAALFKRDDDCFKKSNEICALDWDYVIDGQDWDLSRVKVGALQVAGDKATVTVSFVNMKTPCVNRYNFVREDGVWKVDDIETRPQGEKPQSIARLLREFKDY